MFPSMSLIVVSPSLTSPLSLILSCCLNILREMWHLMSWCLSGSWYIEILCMHHQMLLCLAMQMCFACWQHLYIIVRVVNTWMLCNMLSKHDYIVHLASLFHTPSKVQWQLVHLLSKANCQLISLYHFQHHLPMSPSLPWVFLVMELLWFIDFGEYVTLPHLFWSDSGLSNRNFWNLVELFCMWFSNFPYVEQFQLE